MEQIRVSTFAGPGTTPVIRTVDWPKVGSKGALIKIGACGVDMLYRTRKKYPWLAMQTLYPFSEDGISRAVADAMAMKTVKSTIVPWPDLVQETTS
jgi:hypothetical protein